jgi:hypothetical protein
MKVIVVFLILTFLPMHHSFSNDCVEYAVVKKHKSKLTEKERNRIYNEIHFSIQLMNRSLEKAELHAMKIKDVDIREAAIDAIKGAMFALAAGSCRAVVIGTCLGALSHIAGESYRNYLISTDYVTDAKAYAEHADELQERLWRDE